MGTHRVLRVPRGSCVSGGPLGFLPLLVPGAPGRIPGQLHGPLALQFLLALAVPRGAQLSLHGGQLVPQLRVHQ